VAKAARQSAGGAVRSRASIEPSQPLSLAGMSRPTSHRQTRSEGGTRRLIGMMWQSRPGS